MKTKNAKNIRTNGQDWNIWKINGINWKITRGAKGANCQGGGGKQGKLPGGAKGKKIAQGGALTLFPHSYSPPLDNTYRLRCITRK